MEYRKIYSEKDLSVSVIGDRVDGHFEHYKLECYNRCPLLIHMDNPKSSGVTVNSLLFIAKHVVESTQLSSNPRVDYQKALDHLNKAIQLLSSNVEEKVNHG